MTSNLLWFSSFALQILLNNFFIKDKRVTCRWEKNIPAVYIKIISRIIYSQPLTGFSVISGISHHIWIIWFYFKIPVETSRVKSCVTIDNDLLRKFPEAITAETGFTSSTNVFSSPLLFSPSKQRKKTNRNQSSWFYCASDNEFLLLLSLFWIFSIVDE